MKEISYLFLKTNLDKKIECLQAILQLVQIQKDIDFNSIDGIPQYEECLDKKDEILKNIDIFNNEFELYMVENYKELGENPDRNSTEKMHLKKKIDYLCCLQDEIEKLEVECKVNLEKFIQIEREKIKNFRIRNQTASSYYKNMNRNQISESYFMDDRK